jgi:hypothetical protein
MVRFASDAADPFVHLELPVGVELARSPPLPERPLLAQSFRTGTDDARLRRVDSGCLPINCPGRQADADIRATYQLDERGQTRAKRDARIHAKSLSGNITFECIAFAA